MEKTIWVWLEQDAGNLSDSSLEVVGEARKIADAAKTSVCAFVFGEGAADAAIQAISYGADTVYLATGPAFVNNGPQACLDALSSSSAPAPRAVLVSGTRSGLGLAPRIAVKLKLGYLSNVMKVKINEDGGMTVNTETHQGKVNSVQTFSSRQGAVLVFQPGSIGVGKAKKRRQGDIVEISLEEAPVDPVEITGFIKADPRTVSVGDAERVVAGGNGFKTEEDLSLLQDLADSLQAATACSKPLADKSWAPYSRLVGQSSGRRLAPDLFVSVGVSGATHFVEGMKESRTIVSINKDKGAPVMKESDLAVVGDLYEIIPKVIEKIDAFRKEAGNDA